MPETLGVASLEIEGDLTPLKRDLDEAKRQAGTAGKQAGKSFSESASAGVKKAALPAAAALGLIAVGVKKTSDSASALNESVNAVEVVYGKAADKVIAASKGMATEAGLSARQFNELVTPIGAALINVGLAEDEAAEKSIDLGKRAADMASVFNVDVADALAAIQAGLRGEADPLERFGVGLSDAAVTAEALSMGLGKANVDMKIVKESQLKLQLAQEKYTKAVKEHGKESTQARQAKLGVSAAERGLAKAMKGSKPELDANAKAQARLSLLMKQTDRVAGDFVNTSDSLANRERINAAEAENTQAKIGQGLLPVMEMYQRAVSAVTGFLGSHIQQTKIAAGVVAGLALGILAINAGLKVYAAGQAAATAATWLWNAALAANPILLIVLGVVALAAAFVIAYKKSETFRKIVHGGIDFIKAHWRTLLLAIFPLAGLFAMLWQRSETFRDIVRGAIGLVKKSFEGMLAAATDVRDFWTQKLKPAAQSTFDYVRGKAETVVEKVQAIIDKLRDLVDDIKALPGKVFGPLGKVAGFVGGIAGKVPGIGDGALGQIGRGPRSVSSGLWDELQAAQAMGLTLTSGYRAGAITSSGNPSLHGVYPSKAIDVAGSTPAMRAFQAAIAGRPGIRELLGPAGGWYPGVGWTRISDQLQRDHLNHVHVGIYDDGGFLPPGVTLAINNTGRPERILKPGAGAGVTINFPHYVGDKRDLMRAVVTGLADLDLEGS